MLQTPGRRSDAIGEKRLAHRHRCRPAILGRLHERALDRLAQGLWCVGTLIDDRTRRLGDVLEKQRHRVPGTERQSSRQHLITDHAERVDVAASVHLAIADRLLGRHVCRRTDRYARGR